jgi:hypothetical protein
MLPLPKQNNKLQIFHPTEQKIFDNYYFKTNRNIPLAGIRYLFYNEVDDELLISSTDNGKVYILNLKTGILRNYEHHVYTVRKVIPYQQDYITASWDNTVRVTNKRSLQPRLTLTTNDMGRCPTLTVSDDGKWVYSFSYDSDKSLGNTNTVRKWSLKTGKLIMTYRETGIHFAFTRSGGLFILNNKVLVTASDSGYLNFLDIKTGNLINSYFQQGTVFRTLLNVQKDVFLVDVSGYVHKFSINEKRYVSRIMAHHGDITCIKFLVKDGKKYLFTTAFDGKIVILELPGLYKISEICAPSAKWSLTFIQDKLMLAGDVHGRILVFDIENINDIKMRGLIHLFHKGMYIANLDKEFGFSPIRSFYTDNISALEVYKGKPEKAKKKEETSSLRIVGVQGSKEKPPVSDHRIGGKEAEYIISACNNFNVFRELFKLEDNDPKKSITGIKFVPMLNEFI